MTTRSSHTAPEQLLVRGGRLLLDTGEEPRCGDVLITDGVIGGIGPNLAADGAETFDARGCLVVPGLVNAHFHSSELFVRGRYDGLSFDQWGLYVYPFLHNPPIPQRLIYLRTLLAGIELLRNGVTAVTDDLAAEVAGQGLETLESVFAAYRDLGLRASCSGNVMNLSQEKTWPFAASFPPDLKREVAAQRFPSVDAYLELCEEAVHRFHDPSGLSLFVVAPVAPQWCTAELIAAAGEFAAQHELNFHTHVLETRWQADVSQRWQGGGFIPYLRDLGVLNHRATLIHGVWLSERDIELIAEADAAVVHCPVANLRLGAGIAPVKRLMRAGATVGLGTDGLALHETPSVLEEARLASMLSRARNEEPTSWVLAHEAFQAATTGGARAMLVHETTGRLAVGAAADLLILRENGLATDRERDTQERLVFASDAASVDTVMVAGEVVFTDGVPTRVHAHEAVAELREYLDFIEREQKEVERRHAGLAGFFAASGSAT